MGIDVWEVIEAAKTKPFGFQAFYPGPGLGGHCIPIDPFYLTWAARKHGLNTRFIELAGEINTAMPQYVVDRIAEALNEDGKPVKGSRVCVLGVAYKKDVDDPRESPAFDDPGDAAGARRRRVLQRPARPDAAARCATTRMRLDSQPLTPEFLAEQDCVLIVTDHSAYDYDLIVRARRLVVDTRNATAGCEPGDCRIVQGVDRMRELASAAQSLAARACGLQLPTQRDRQLRGVITWQCVWSPAARASSARTWSRRCCSAATAVRVLDNFSTGSRGQPGRGARPRRGDRRRHDRPGNGAAAMRGVEVVFHQAALASVPRSVADPLATHQRLRRRHAATCCWRRATPSVRRVVYAASSSAYGNSARLPKSESDPTAPLSPYAVAKLAGEHYCAAFSEVYGLETVRLRYFNVFGPRQTPDSPYAAVIPLFIQALTGRPRPDDPRRRRAVARLHLRRRRGAGEPAGGRRRRA